MTDVANFLPSTNGLQFTNSWPDVPDVVVNLGPLGKVKIGSASKGLCGGMVFTALDVYWAGLPPLQDSQPPQGSPLFTYIVRRLIDSWHLPFGVLTYYQWMMLPDHDKGIRSALFRGVGRRTVVDEWPQIRAEIDAGHAAPLGLVTTASANPVRLGENHQVLAYGYELLGDHLTLKVYDPNTDLVAADEVRISLCVADSAGKTTITHNVAIAAPIRGFFRVPYTPADPRRLVPAGQA